MKALVYTGTEKLEYKNFDDPNIVNDESIIKVSASGICGSDMHAYHGKDDRRIPPLILGHEVSGEVQNGKFKGKDVVLNPLITCGKCDYCQKYFASSQKLKNHINTLHEGQSNYKCDACGKSFTQSGNLKTHIKAVHEKIKPVSCEHCEYKCTTKDTVGVIHKPRSH